MINHKTKWFYNPCTAETSRGAEAEQYNAVIIAQQSADTLDYDFELTLQDFAQKFLFPFICG
jgi:hypothetical protein